jgi:lipid A 3-O-deacylase
MCFNLPPMHPFGLRFTSWPGILLALAITPTLSGQTEATPAAATPSPAVPAPANYLPKFPAGIWELSHENDVFIYSDRDYTSGLRLAYTTPNYQNWSDVPGCFNYSVIGGFIDRISLIDDSAATNAVGVYAAQNIYTPNDLTLNPPDPTDHPYAGWVGLGKDFIRQTMDRRAIFETNLGWVGPYSGAEDLQDSFHSAIGSENPAGWEDQIKNEPVLQVTYRQDWRIPALTNLNPSVHETFGYDVIGHGLATVGNGWDYAAVGALVRMGYQLPFDFGPARPRFGEIASLPYQPGGSTTSDTLGALSAYLCAGAEARAVARDITLNGNTIANSASVVQKPVVGEVYGGLVVAYGHFRGDFLVVFESDTFESQGQVGQWRGILTLGCQF